MSHRRKKKTPSEVRDHQSDAIDDKATAKLNPSTSDVTRNCESDEHHANRNNEQQQSWYWRWYGYLKETWNSNGIIAVGTIILGIVGIGSLVLTKLTLDESRQALRPYVSLGRKDGVIAEFVAGDDPTVPVGIRLYLQNGGQSPALNPQIAIQLKSWLTTTRGALHPTKETPYQSKGEPFRLITRFTSPASSSAAVGNSIAPQSEYIHYAPNQLSLEQLRLLQNGDRALLLAGMLQYCDEFGNYTCRSFLLWFNGPPDNSFSESPETDCTDLYSYPAPTTSNERFLLPCEQPVEREAREKQERDDLAKQALLASNPSATATATPVSK